MLPSFHFSFFTPHLLAALIVWSRSLQGSAGRTRAASKNTSSLWLQSLLSFIPSCLPLCPPPVITVATYGSTTPVTDRKVDIFMRV